MESVSRCLLIDAEKDGFIATLTPHLANLRTQAEISQEKLANLIGVSRKTYSTIENNLWNIMERLSIFDLFLRS